MPQIISKDGEIREVPCRTRFNYNTDRASEQSAVLFIQPGEEGYDGKTQQNFKEECDINEIVRRFNITGQIPENVRIPQYIDYEGIFDFQTAMSQLMQAEESFMEIPADIRAKFDNSPQKFLEFCAKPENKDKLKEYGLLKPEKVVTPPEPLLVRVQPEPVATGTSTPT